MFLRITLNATREWCGVLAFCLRDRNRRYWARLPFEAR